MGEVYGLTLVTQIRDNFWWALYDKKHLMVVMKDCFYVNLEAYCLQKEISFRRCRDENFGLFDFMRCKYGVIEASIHDFSCHPKPMSFEDKLVAGVYYHPLLLPHIISIFDTDLMAKFKMYPPPSYMP